MGLNLQVVKSQEAGLFQFIKNLTVIETMNDIVFSLVTLKKYYLVSLKSLSKQIVCYQILYFVRSKFYITKPKMKNKVFL